tara:strand:- start:1148 stop:1741 length:594 start_codon:yes stop_codon:yes gene_type:complete
MTTANYLSGRKKYTRPQGMLFADNPGTVDDGFHIPAGDEFTNFIILSDDNRDAIDIKINRIEEKQRTINGRMRSYHIADKVNISTSWKTLTSRTASDTLIIDQESGATFVPANATSYTSDFGAGGVDLLNWYENNKGSFWVYLAYDKFSNFETDKYNKMNRYNEVVEVMFDDFSYNVVSRGATTHDFWDISLSLEEI